MKKMISIFCALLLASTQAFATPPSDIKIQFDPATKLLSALVYHQVSDPENHYVKTVVIRLNGKEVETLSFNKQDNNATQTVMATVPEAKKGDMLSVEAHCCLNGKLKKEIKVA